MNLNTSLKTAIKTKSNYYALLDLMELKTVRDLLEYYPRTYGDESDMKTIQDIEIGPLNTLQGTVFNLSSTRTRYGKTIQKGVFTDKNGESVDVVWFNQPHITRMLHEGSEIILSGKAKYAFGKVTLQSPKFEYVKAEQIHTGRLVPVYPQHDKITSQWLREKIYPLQSLADEFEENLPENILKKEGLLSKAEAVREIHFPSSVEKLEKAQERLAFEELFGIQLNTLKRKKKWAEENEGKGKSFPMDLNFIKSFLGTLPFELTESQKISLYEILKDIEKPVPMLRLLEGDVGSGKTVVSLIPALQVVAHGAQVLFMSPTEVLANQHFQTVRKLVSSFKFQVSSKNKTVSKATKVPLEGDEGGVVSQVVKCDSLNQRQKTNVQLGDVEPETNTPQPPQGGLAQGTLFQGEKKGEINVRLLIGSTKTKEKNEILLEMMNGEVDIVIGTHSLIQKNVNFFNLGLAVIDEQHRFGVEQREKVETYGHPHILNMTATPIPRTLAIVAYGDQDLSVIKALPHGRKPINTKVITTENERKEVYRFIESEIEKGRQVFVICPLVNDSESDMLQGVKSATQEYEYLKNDIFPHLKLGLIHGKLKSDEKDQIMQQFAKNEFNLLVATSVIEVGIDIPNATMILIEGAERFGLAQLHQFRGRVGRGEYQSHCFLFPSTSTSNENERLKALEKHTDGFMLAEIDMRLRGPGEVYGTRQSGIPDLKMATLTDAKLLKRTREAAEEVLGINQ